MHIPEAACCIASPLLAYGTACVASKNSAGVLPCAQRLHPENNPPLNCARSMQASAGGCEASQPSGTQMASASSPAAHRPVGSSPQLPLLSGSRHIGQSERQQEHMLRELAQLGRGCASVADASMAGRYILLGVRAPRALALFRPWILASLTILTGLLGKTSHTYALGALVCADGSGACFNASAGACTDRRSCQACGGGGRTARGGASRAKSTGAVLPQIAYLSQCEQPGCFYHSFLALLLYCSPSPHLLYCFPLQQ